MKEAHDSTFTTYLGSTKMYDNLRKYFWWIGIKKDIANYVARCLACKTEHQKLGGYYNLHQFPYGNRSISPWILLLDYLGQLKTMMSF